MKFYDCSTAPSPRRVRMVLAEKQASVPTVEVDLRKGEQLTEAFRAINPRCTVPVLELDDGSYLNEALAISWYLERRFPEPSLFGETAQEQARVLMWNAFCEQEGFYAAAEAFRNRAKGLKDRALTGAHGYAQIDALAERGRTRVQRWMADLDARLAQQQFIAGDRFTVADITAFVAIDFAGWVKLTVPAEQVNLTRWYEAVAARPSASV